MDITLNPSVLCGAIEAIPSKSHAHRLLICASLSDKPCSIICPASSEDIEATASCMRALGADIRRTEQGYEVIPIDKRARKSEAVLDCGESGSTLRFLLPVAAALGADTRFNMHGRLPSRPLSPLYEILSENGITMSEQGSNPLCISGVLRAKEFSIAANVSSQFISGLLFACPIIADKCTVKLTTAPESTGYIDMTVECMRQFGITVNSSVEDGLVRYEVSGRYTTQKSIVKAEGDWSNAAFWLCAGAIGSAPVAVTGLNSESLQPDKKIIEILTRFGAGVEHSGDKYCISPASLCGCEIDVKNTPDLVPAIAVVAACAMGKTTITGAQRLKIKESDRIRSVCDMIGAIGGEAEPAEDSMTIHGTGISGGTVDSCNDHRIAMAAAIASAASADAITILGAQSTKKSYPAFFEDMAKLTLDFDKINNL